MFVDSCKYQESKALFLMTANYWQLQAETALAFSESKQWQQDMIYNFVISGPVRSLVKDKENNGFLKWKIFIYNPELITFMSP